MTGNKPALLVLLLLLNLGLSAGMLFAGEKATDLMSLALKNKSIGKTGLAIEQLQRAVSLSPNSMQKNLALFMLGDCQLGAGKYSHAVKTFKKLREIVVDPEERAEAIFRLLQAETFSGNSKNADRLLREMKKNHRKSPYYELTKSFVKAQGLVKSADLKIATTSIPSLSSQGSDDSAKIVKMPEKAKKEASSKVKVLAKTSKTNPKKRPEKLNEVPSETADLLKEILTIEVAENKSELVAKILVLQDKLKNGPQQKGMDQALYELAVLTTRFGESLEACKLYDQLLNLHPSSPHVESAYYEAIRLRASLGVHEAVVSWAKAFLGAFPASDLRNRVKALLLYSERNGKIDLSKAKKPSKKAAKRSSNPGMDESEKLKVDRDYIQAARKMEEGKYNLALIDLKNLTKTYPRASKVWWDMALVYVQFEDYHNAEKSTKKMLEINPGSEEGNSLLGYIHYRLEEYQKAASAYGKAGAPDGKGVTFFDAKSAAERMKRSVGSK